MGLRLAFWTVDTSTEIQDLDSILSYVKAGTKPGAIILMHDGGANRLQTVAPSQPSSTGFLTKAYSSRWSTRFSEIRGRPAASWRACVFSMASSG